MLNLSGGDMLRFTILKDENSDLDLYNKSYQLWHNVWSKHYYKVEGKTSFFSDPFLFNDEICVITNNHEPIAVFFLSFFNADVLARLNTSYLNNYPEGLVENKIAKDNINKICLYSNITVAKEYRMQNPEFLSIAKLQFSLAVHRFDNSGADILFGYCRNEKGINALAIDHGAEVLATESRHKGVCDFISILKKDIQQTSNIKIKIKAFELWIEYNQGTLKIAS